MEQYPQICFDKMEKYRIFASSITICDVNDLRYNLFYGKRGDMEYMQLLPCTEGLCVQVHSSMPTTAIWWHYLERRHILGLIL
jgi:hypothetical protein